MTQIITTEELRHWPTASTCIDRPLPLVLLQVQRSSA